MPKANGLNLLITLKQRYPKMKVIMLTNLAEPQYRNTCKAFGADYFFDKSVDFDRIDVALIETLNQLIQVIKKPGNDK
jgi:DNA-binding NarL/FixJ family response regulator